MIRADPGVEVASQWGKPGSAKVHLRKSLAFGAQKGHVCAGLTLRQTALEICWRPIVCRSKRRWNACRGDVAVVLCW